jgi:hypothetical protein
VRPDRLDRAVAPQQERQRVPAGRARDPEAFAYGIEARVDDRAELLGRRLPQGARR